MFDSETEERLSRAPSLAGLDGAALPSTMTEAYARLVTERLRGQRAQADRSEISPGWSLPRIADTYEALAAILDAPEERAASAFVAATAQQLLSREAGAQRRGVTLARDSIDSRISAPLLFMAAKQYADAAESAKDIPLVETGESNENLLIEAVKSLAIGKLDHLSRLEQSYGPQVDNADATQALYGRLLEGIFSFADDALRPASALNRPDRQDFPQARDAFQTVLDLSTGTHVSDSIKSGKFTTYYSGPFHLARLLLMMIDAIGDAATTRIPVPPGANPEFWYAWLEHRALSTPFLWPNHQVAVSRDFHLRGASALLILPTGAGKTTVSCLKIATVLAGGGNVVFVVPTNALADQLARDLSEVFPESLLGSAVSSAYDDLMEGVPARRIEVMTPERCLAVLSFAPQSLLNVGLMVFDECHMIDPSSGYRRALDAMFCVLAFSSICVEADYLFLSAMVNNGSEFSAWIEELTGRSCQAIDLVWKPSRQARGVVAYRRDALEASKSRALEAQNRLDVNSGREAKGLRSAAGKELSASPFAVFGLQHNWRSQAVSHRATAVMRLTREAVTLNGKLEDGQLRLTANVNHVASVLASNCAREDLKTIVFTNQRPYTEKIARSIVAALDDPIQSHPEEDELWLALSMELGGLSHSPLERSSVAVMHHSRLIRVEREISEMSFRRLGGARVIVATPTLAQGLNLPAEVAIIAGDARFDNRTKSRSNMQSHEVLNAAARAGRAGHLANGLVLLVPDGVLDFSDVEDHGTSLLNKLEYILPLNDHCVDVRDPLELVLDQIMDSSDVRGSEVVYAINRLQTLFSSTELGVSESASELEVPLARSFAAFMSRKRGEEQAFQDRLTRLHALSDEFARMEARSESRKLAAQAGLSPEIVESLWMRVGRERDSLPKTISDWVHWAILWLQDDSGARSALLGQSWSDLCDATGFKELGADPVSILGRLELGIQAWISGDSLFEIDVALGGPSTDRSNCDRARGLSLSVIPLSFSSAMGLIGQVVSLCETELGSELAPRSVLEVMARAVRLGFSSPQQVAFHDVVPRMLSRVQYHDAFRSQSTLNFAVARSVSQSAVVRNMRIAVRNVSGSE